MTHKGGNNFACSLECESSVQFMWESLGKTEVSYQLWKKHLNDIMPRCFRKKKIQKDKNCLLGRQGGLLIKENMLKLNFFANSFPLRVIEIFTGKNL